MLRRTDIRKLLLHKETIRELGTLRLGEIKGGYVVSPRPCPPQTAIWTCTTEVESTEC